MHGSIPTFEELFKINCTVLPDYLKGTKRDSENKSAPLELKKTTAKKPDT
jgi:hypothetical protein